MKTSPNEKAPGTLAGVQGAQANTNTARIVPLPVIPENIPTELKRFAQWLVWRVVVRDGKPSKVPFNARTGRFGKTNDPATWCDFETAMEAYRTGKYDGVGFAFAAGDGLFGVDIDHVIDPPTGAVEPWALEILETFRSTYIEVSPSGTGLRIFAKGKPERCGKAGPENRLEIYDHTSPRYLTVTGARWLKP